MRGWLAVVVVLAGCGGSPSAPSPQPTPSPVPVPAPAPSPAPVILPDPLQFDATFNAQFVHDVLEEPTTPQRAILFNGNPTIYLQSDGLSPETVAALETEARAIVPLLSGGTLSLAAFTVTGATLHPLTRGAIVVELMPDTAGPNCGLTDVGAAAGHIKLYIHIGCNRPWVDVFGHELGHALGFYHVADSTCMMSISRPLTHNGAPCDKERYHAGLAYQSNGAYRTD